MSITAMEKFLLRRGEALSLEPTSEAGIETVLYASLVNSTNATYSLANRGMMFDGIMQKGGQLGQYLRRASDGDFYFIESIQPESDGHDRMADSRLERVFVVKCNTVVRIERELGEDDETIYDDNGDLVSEAGNWVLLYDHVRVFKDVATRSDKAVNDGRIDQAIVTMHIPKCYSLQKGYRITEVVNGKEADCYRVESINNALSPIEDIGVGVNIAQLSADNRV